MNFTVDGLALVFRISSHGALGSLAWGIDVAFEADHIDLNLRRGWSVVVKGCAHIVDDPGDEDRLRSLCREPQPWVDGLRRMYVRIPWREITGRVVGEDWLGTPRPLAHNWFGYWSLADRDLRVQHRGRAAVLRSGPTRQH